MACKWCGSKQAAIDEGDSHECIRCYTLRKAIEENPKAARKILGVEEWFRCPKCKELLGLNWEE